jgi:hypothetical protein
MKKSVLICDLIWSLFLLIYSIYLIFYKPVISNRDIIIILLFGFLHIGYLFQLRDMFRLYFKGDLILIKEGTKLSPEEISEIMRTFKTV